MSSKSNVKISLFLDVREGKKTKSQSRNNTNSVSLRIWDPLTKRAKIRRTGIELSEDEFERVWVNKRPRPKDMATRNLLQSILTRFVEAADSMEYFNMEELDRKVSTPSGEIQNVVWHYEQKIIELKSQGRIGTADSYGYACRAFVEYSGSPKLFFTQITPKWLEGFERWMESRGKSLTTVGIYVRTLRAIYNSAVSERIVTEEQYPFGKRRYTIPAGRKPKKALTAVQLKELYEIKLNSTEQEMARDFFFFSYAANGMNVSDIANLQYTDLFEDKFSFIRQKTRNTRKEMQVPIVVYLNPYMTHVIEKYGNSPGDSPFVFRVLSKNMNPESRYRAVRNFNRFLNQHLKSICEIAGLPVVSTYWARHSFATISVQRGASMEFMRESLGHSDVKTTQLYFGGFDDDVKRTFAQNIMKF